MTCPGCGRPLDAAKFLCNTCADSAPDALIVAAGQAVDDDDTSALDAALAEIVGILTD